MRSDRLHETLLPKRVALPVFASDALSSVAYAPDEIFLTLSIAGFAAYSYSWKVGIAVALVMLVVTIFVTLAIIAVLVFLVVWGFSLVVQWLVNNTARFQALYAQATEWLDGHGVSITGLVADSYNPGWIISAVREIGGRGYSLISFIVIAFAFIVLGLLEVDIARKNIERLKNQKLRQSLLIAAGDIAEKFQKYMVVRSTMSVLTGLVVWSFALVAGTCHAPHLLLPYAGVIISSVAAIWWPTT
jgi:predicted PurR-regulated permease PerM